MLSFLLGSIFLTIILAPAFIIELSRALRRYITHLTTCHNPLSEREFWEEERAMQVNRKRRRQEWHRRKREKKRQQQKHPGGGGGGVVDAEEEAAAAAAAAARAACEDSDPEIALEFEPTEGGRDRLLRDVAYYARRVGLDARKHIVQTEDGYILDLWRIFDPKEEVVRAQREEAQAQGKEDSSVPPAPARRYPILLISGLFQHVGSYCVNDDSSIAFYLYKTGYDVWLGGNRCGFRPQHAHLRPTNPNFWSWTVQHMGVYDLPAHVAYVRAATHFPKIALVGHSQGTTQTFIALSHHQRPDLAAQISVFCALAPAVFAGPTLNTLPFRFFRSLSRRTFSVLFGTHTFLPAMMHAYDYVPARIYGSLAYLIFTSLFHWSDARWERRLKARMFGFSPILVSTEHIWWWVGRDGFGARGCVFDMPGLESQQQEEEEEEEQGEEQGGEQREEQGEEQGAGKGWFPEGTPPMALWVPSSDNLVDGMKFLEHVTDKKREPHVDVVHATVVPGYEHLDVLWAVDSVEKVASEVANVIWETAVGNNNEDGLMVPRSLEEKGRRERRVSSSYSRGVEQKR